MGIKGKIKNAVKGAVRLFVPEHTTIANVCTLAPSELLRGRTALITGGTSGIGYAIARAFLDAGATVAITSRSEEKARLAADRLNAATSNGCKAYGLGMDNGRPAEFASKLSELTNLIGGVKILTF